MKKIKITSTIRRVELFSKLWANRSTSIIILEKKLDELEFKKKE
jgi:hypothetical protein